MGTSTKLPGPVGGSWRRARGALTRSLVKVGYAVADQEAVSDRGGGASTGAPAEAAPELIERWQEVEAGRHGEAFLEALASELRADVAAFGLVETSWRAGDRLVDAMEALGREGPAVLGPVAGSTADERVELWVARFVARTVGEGGALTDAVARRAATHAAEVLLRENPVLRHAVETGSHVVTVSIGDGLFCAIYRLFFADMVTEFLTAVIAGKITLTVPLLPALDPAGHIGNWLAEKVVEMIPTPCQEKEERGDGRSVAELGHELARDTLLRAFGIEDGHA